MASHADLYEIGRIPPLGVVPPRMYAQLIRPERFGEPERAFQVEVVDTPQPARDEVLVLVMAAGINYNNVWAARGVPIDVTKVHARLGEPEEFDIGGSDASGVVWALGEGVQNLRVGDHVIVHCGQWDADDPVVAAGGDPGFPRMSLCSHPGYEDEVSTDATCDFAERTQPVACRGVETALTTPA